ncbi:hypothetical protein WJX79_010701 [Trebouxia sp. C0005]
MYQDHLTASVSLYLLELGRPLLPASFHVAAQSCCFQASTGGQVALLLLLPDQHSRSGCTAAVMLVLHRRAGAICQDGKLEWQAGVHHDHKDCVHSWRLFSSHKL